ncbi:MAG TPA: hypothetical protein V6D17_07350, partial [Candidatus Obscuribacterales bacterium]
AGMLAASLFAIPIAAWSQLPMMQQPSLVPIGTVNLPAGQYLMTSLSTGQSVYVAVNQSGQMMAQDPRLLQFSVQASQTAGPLGQPVAQPGGWGSLLRHGLDSLVQPKMQQIPMPMPNQMPQ